MYYIIEYKNEKSIELIKSDKMINDVNEKFEILKVIYTLDNDEAIKIYDNFLNNLR